MHSYSMIEAQIYYPRYMVELLALQALIIVQKRNI